MTYAELQKLLLLADSMVASCAPKKADYGRGYRMGIQIHFDNNGPESIPDHYSIAEIARANGCRNVDAFASGYRDGCTGLKPEYVGWTSSPRGDTNRPLNTVLPSTSSK